MFELKWDPYLKLTFKFELSLTKIIEGKSSYLSGVLILGKNNLCPSPLFQVEKAVGCAT